MKGVALFVAVCSMVVSLSLAVVIVTMRPAPAGVCVIDYREDDQRVVQGVEQAIVVDGVVTCQEGAYVPVTAR